MTWLLWPLAFVAGSVAVEVFGAGAIIAALSLWLVGYVCGAFEERRQP